MKSEQNYENLNNLRQQTQTIHGPSVQETNANIYCIYRIHLYIHTNK